MSATDFVVELDTREARKLAAKRAYQDDYRKTDKAKETKRRTRKSITDAKYLGRRIVAVDGEGINVRNGTRKGEHDYVLLAISDKKPLLAQHGLSTANILRYLHSNLDNADLNVIYGGSYDFNCWLKDFPADKVRRIYNGHFGSKPVWFGQYGVRWTRGKCFEIVKWGSEKTVTIYDVISFFQCPFIQACDDYLGEYEGREQLVREKARRGNFSWREIQGISAYNTLELDLLVELVSELRIRLNRVGLRPRRWIGPGAIAAALFTKYKIKEHRNERLPESVMEAARYAYAGGRFEVIKYGAVNDEAYEYDINSAYPRALSDVPSLAQGSWGHWEGVGPVPDASFALYSVRYRGTNPRVPGPVFVRGSNGTISYPLHAENWIWTPEYEVLREYCEQVQGATYEVLEAWYYIPAPSNVKPFGFIPELFKKRRELKACGDGAHVGIKLGLNSLYGKLAQQVGWRRATEKFPLRIPSYHQLEWAGYATSWCRANVLRAALEDLDSVIAFETDALFTSKPLTNIVTGEGLGEWEETVFESLTYVQSGHYYGTAIEKGKRKEIVKCRGVDKGYIKRKSIEDALRRNSAEPCDECAQLGTKVGGQHYHASLTRFFGAGIALVRGLDNYWRRWLTEPKVLQLGPAGKRVHGSCWCSSRDTLAMGVWHNTYCPVLGGKSSEYPIAWINPDPDMTELEELREQEKYYEDD